MSLTSNQAPTANSLYFAGDYLLVDFSSDQTGQTGFRYQLTVDMNGTEVFKTYVRPNASGRLVADLSDIVQNNLDPVLEAADGTSVWDRWDTACPSMGAKVQVGVQEYYTASVQGSETTVDFFVVAGYGQQSEGIVANRHLFAPEIDTAAGFLSVRALHEAANFSVSVPENHPYPVVIPMQDFTGDDLNRFSYTGGSATVADLTSMPNADSAFTDGSFVYVLDYGPASWGASRWNITGASATFYGRVASPADVRTLKVTINEIGEHEQRSPYVSVYWLNELGGLDYLLFDGRLKTTSDVEHEQRQGIVGGFDASAKVDKYRHNLVSFSREVTTEIEVTKTHLTDIEVRLAASLQRSRAAWMKTKGEDVKPVMINSVDFDNNVQRTSKLRPCTLSMTLSLEERC